MDRIVEEHWGRNPGDNEAAVYFAMLKHSVTGLLATHDRFTPDTDYRKEIGEVLRIMRDRVGPPDGAEEAEPEWPEPERSEEHTSELQSLMRISYAVFCLKKKNKQIKNDQT